MDMHSLPLHRKDTIDIFAEGSKKGICIAKYGRTVSSTSGLLQHTLNCSNPAIRRSISWLLYYKIFDVNISISTHSKSAFRKLSGVYSISRL